MDTVKCSDEACERTFITDSRRRAHEREVHLRSDAAEATQTFSDIEDLVRDAVREKYYVEGDYKASPAVPTTWAWVRDLAEDWVVFVVEKGGDDTLYKASYSLANNVVTLGEPVEVVRKTVYEAVTKKES